MDVLKSLSKPTTGRRSFVLKMGAAMTAAMAAAVPSMAKSVDGKNTDADHLAKQLGILEDEKAICKLHRTYEAFLDNGKYEEVTALFADNAEVAFNGGVFKGKSGVSRLYLDRFNSGLTGKSIGSVPGFEGNAEQQQETVKVAADRLSAKAQFPYSIQVGAPMASDSSLVNMARLHGGGIVKWHEAGIYEISYVKDMKSGSWKIQRFEYRVLSTTDYRPGKSSVRPISVPAFAKTYPEDASGPDRLITTA
jgi:hypothetical protein